MNTEGITVREIVETLPFAEKESFYREALEATSFRGFPDTEAAVLKSWRLLLLDCVVNKYAERLKTGKFPDEIARDKERTERREGWLWLLVIVLGLALVAGCS